MGQHGGMKLRLLGDACTLDDQLDHWPLVKSLGEQIAACSPPMAIGVHGAWGSGKTSFLGKLEHYLGGSSPVLARRDLLGPRKVG